MIKLKEKDLSKVSLNSQDVMLKLKVKCSKASELNLDLSAMNKEDREAMEEILSITIVAVGKEVTEFKVGQLASLKSERHLPAYDALNEDKTERAVVLSQSMISYAIDSPENTFDDVL